MKSKTVNPEHYSQLINANIYIIIKFACFQTEKRHILAQSNTINHLTVTQVAEYSWHQDIFRFAAGVSTLAVRAISILLCLLLDFHGI